MGLNHVGLSCIILDSILGFNCTVLVRDNLWKSRGRVVVNGAPREVPEGGF